MAECFVNSIEKQSSCIFPVGYIYMSVDSTSPSTYFGGTWERIENRFLIAAGSSYSAGSTGGSATVTLTTEQMPSHKHALSLNNLSTSEAGLHTHTFSGGTNSVLERATRIGYNYNEGQTTTSAAGAHTHTITGSGTIDNTGGGQAHENMPPYLAVYMWKRTA